MSNSEKPFGTADNSVGSYRPKTLEEIERDAVVIRTTEETSPPEKKEPQKAEPIARPENGLLAARKRAAASKAGESKKEKAKGRKKSKEEKSREKRTPLHSKTSDSGDEKTSGTSKSETGLKIRRFFYPAFCFFRRHKALTITLSVILVIVLSGALTVNHFLNKINYVSQDDYANLKKVYDDEKQIKYITLSTGEIIDVSNLSKNADGTYNRPDGRRFTKDRTIWNTDGSIVFYDGSYLLPDGTAVLTDGTTFYPNELLVFQDGSFYEKTKIVAENNETLTFNHKVNRVLKNYFIINY